jgi:hypothetical protein
LLRITPGDVDGYSKKKMDGINYKFGCDVDGAKVLLDKAMSLGLEVVGIRYVYLCMQYVHVGALCIPIKQTSKPHVLCTADRSNHARRVKSGRVILYTGTIAKATT